MNNEKLHYWAQLIYIPDDLNLRESPGDSVHQRKIREILGLVREASENPTVDVYERLRSVRPIPCPDNIKGFVNYCKYLLYCVDKLNIFVHLDEGNKNEM